jgi:hypothetical protein
MTTSEQLEREAEETRARIAETLEELRARVTPGRLVDQLVDYARNGGGGRFLGNLRRQVEENPLPIAVMGAGLGWLMMASGHSAGRGSRHGAHHTATEAGGVAARAHDATEGLQESARSAASTVRGAASSAGASVSEAVASVFDASAHGARRAARAVSGSTTAMQRGVTGATHGIERLFREQPLIVAGLGLALGAVLGAALPATETEDRILGNGDDSSKDKEPAGASKESGGESTVPGGPLRESPPQESTAQESTAQENAAQAQPNDTAPTLVPVEKSEVRPGSQLPLEPDRV